jgi:uncharacterized protein YbgA (DUF1722 family)
MDIEGDDNPVEIIEKENEWVSCAFKNKLLLNRQQKTMLIFHSFTNLLNVLLEMVGQIRFSINSTNNTVFMELISSISKAGRLIQSSDVFFFFF